MACLIYNSSPIFWKGEKYEREQFIKMRIKHIQSISEGNINIEKFDQKVIRPASIT